MLVLAAGNRMRRRDDFETAIRRGRRAGRSCVTVHLLAASSSVAVSRSDGPLVGFVVGRTVGDAVTRNTVRRRLRHLVKDRLDKLPANALVVIRAHPPAGAATSAVLAVELDAALDRLLSRSVGPGLAGPTHGRSGKGQRTVS